MSDMFIYYKDICKTSISLRWRHDERDGVSNHQPYDYLLDRLFRHQSSASLAYVRGIHRGQVNSPYKGPVTRKMFPFDDVIMSYIYMLGDGDCF